MTNTNRNSGPARLVFNERIGNVDVFTCGDHDHGNLPQFYATIAGDPTLYGPAATNAAAERIARNH